MKKKVKPHQGLKCLQCGKVMFSEYRHDFVICDCANQAFVDGGYDYIRLGAVDFSKTKRVGRDKKGKIVEWDI